MASVTIYVEGGGDDRKSLGLVRQAFREFFCEFRGRMPRIISCGSRGAAYEDFMTALRIAARNGSPGLIILLVDAEAEVRVASAKQHLSERDRWDLRGIDDDQVHLMVQAIEAWMIADRGALRDYFGQGFSENPLPGRPPETIPKDDLKRALKEAGRETNKKGYNEIADGTAILAMLDPATVRAKCLWCKRLFGVLSREAGVPLPDLQ